MENKTDKLSIQRLLVSFLVSLIITELPCILSIIFKTTELLFLAPISFFLGLHFGIKIANKK